MIKLKRAYDAYSDEDGTRILVDRLWPRGLSKDKARIDIWLKDIAPSTQLRQWFGHDPARWEEFKVRYETELTNNAAVSELKNYTKEGTISLIYSAKDTKHNQALALKEYLEK